MHPLAKLCTTLLLASAFIGAYCWLVVKVGKQSTQGTDPALWATGLTMVAYFGWLFALAASKFELWSYEETSLARSARRNFKFSLWAIALCLPAAFLFIGLVAPPFIVAISAVMLIGAITTQWRNEPEA